MIDKYYDRKYDREAYNCLHFASEVWAELTGEDILSTLNGLLGVQFSAKNSGPRKQFEKLERPQSPCIAVGQRKGMTPHVGIYLDRRIVHISPNGVAYQPIEIAMLGATRVSFYK